MSGIVLSQGNEGIAISSVLANIHPSIPTKLTPPCHRLPELLPIIYTEMIKSKMKHLRFVSLSMGLFIGTSALIGCGRKEAIVEPSSENAAPVVSEPSSEQDDSTTSTTSSESSSSMAATPINPPKSAALTAQQADAQINLRAQPTTASASKGYGLVGDSVKLLQAAEGEDGLTWYYVKFSESGAEGWIRGDFVGTTTAATNVAQQRASVDIDSFTTDELFAMGSGGCGMTLWPVDTQEYIFFNGLEDTGMWMKLDGDMTQFRRTSASGPEFYGQAGSQSFVSLDSTTEVQVTVNVGSEKGYESVNVEQGTLRLETPNGATEITVAGNAGC